MISVNQAVFQLLYDADLNRLLETVWEATDPDLVGNKADQWERNPQQLLADLVAAGIVTRSTVVKLRRIARLVRVLVELHDGPTLRSLASLALDQVAFPN